MWSRPFSMNSCFNPCCSGSASRTQNRSGYCLFPASFNPCCSGSASRTQSRLCIGSLKRVSILVVLDQPLGQTVFLLNQFIAGGFNPCCSGSASRTLSKTSYSLRDFSFNPCCSGSASRTKFRTALEIYRERFQSLLFWISL